MLRVLLCVGATVLATALLHPNRAVAQSDPAAQALIDRLKPTLGSGTRGLRLPAERTAAMPAAPAAATRVVLVPLRPPLPATVAELAEAPPSVSIIVTFATASAILTAEAERVLAPLGRALLSADLSPYRFRIEGHTDSVGDAVLNQALSERRAAAVRDYLVRTFEVDARRLISVGFGASQPVVRAPPQTPEARNRRVQVVNLGV